MNESPKVSVIVPIYKVEKYLRKCVDSILCQTLADIQIILVDDGSPDGCPAICDAYAQQDPRVLVVHKENGGLLRARISGVEVASAEYIGFVDGDDFISPDMFEKLYQNAQSHQAQLTCCCFWLYYEDGRTLPYQWDFPSGFFTGDRLEKEFYPHWFEERKIQKIGLVKGVWCKLFDRALLRQVYARIPGQVTIGEDLIASYAVAALAERIVVLPDVRPYFYRQSQGSMMGGYWRDFYNNETVALSFLTQMPCREQAKPFLAEGLERYRAYMMYDILYNECKPNKASTQQERAAIAKALTEESRWQEAAKLDVLARDNQTSRLFRQLILHRRPKLLLAVIWLATQKNKLIQVIKHGK